MPRHAHPVRPIHRHLRWGRYCAVTVGHRPTDRRLIGERWEPMNVTLTPVPDPHREDLYLSSPLGDAVSPWGARVTDAETGDLIGLVVETPPGSWPALMWMQGKLVGGVSATASSRGRLAVVDAGARLLIGADVVRLGEALDTLCRTARRARATAEDEAALAGILP
jgi:hypothetical protein